MPIYCGVDFHARQQVIVWSNTDDGEIHHLKLWHDQLEQVQAFYAGLPRPAIVGLEASGYSAWFEQLLFELHHTVWIGNAAEIRKRARARQKTDRRDAETIFDLLLKDEFPRIYRPAPDSQAVLQKLRHRHRLVQLRSKARNHLHALALAAGCSMKAQLLSKAGRARLQLLPFTATQKEQREAWLALIDQLNPLIRRIEKELPALI